MDFEKITVEKKDGVGIITFNSPKTLNNLGLQVRKDLQIATDDLANDDNIAVVMLIGTGKSFSAGGDVSLMSEGYSALEGFNYMEDHYAWVKQFYHFPKPTIAAVNGFAVGGGFSVALLCDIIFASESAKFGMAFRNVGLVPDLGILYTLPKLIGMNMTKELAYTGRIVDAHEAKQLGIVNKVFFDEELFEETFNFAKELAKGPRVSYRMAKLLLNQAANTTLETELDMEALAQGQCFASEDGKNALKSFVKKEKPVFIGR